MSKPSDTRRQAQQAEILARLALGPVLTRVCRAPGMPHVKSVGNWARADPAFAARLALARQRGASLRASPFDAAIADTVLERLWAGEPIAAILRDRAMPGRRVYRHWTATQPAFAQQVGHVKQVSETARCLTRWHQHRRIYQRPWDPLTAEAIHLRVLRGETLPVVLADHRLSRTAFRRWRRERPELDLIMQQAIRLAPRARGPIRTARYCTPELTERIEHRILNGASLYSLSKRPDMPCAVTLYKWVRTRPDFAAAIASACRFRDDRYVDQVTDLAQRRGRAADPDINAIIKRLGQLNPYPGERREG